MLPLAFLIGFLFCSLKSYPIDIMELSSFLHNQCLSILPLKGQWKPVYEALICGQRLPKGPIKQAFTEGGLIHLMVVSGAHLIFMEKLWMKCPLPFFKKTGLFLFIVLYALITHLHPPVVRALFSFFLFQLSHSGKLFWSHSFVTQFSGILCLIHSPHWIHSSSLQLSWLAALAYGISSSPVKKAFIVYIVVFPLISQWQFLHPLTVLINWLLAPVIGFILLPLSFITALFSFLQPLSDTIWSSIFIILKWVSELLPNLPKLSIFKNLREYTWVYIGSMFLISHTIAIWFKRTRH